VTSQSPFDIPEILDHINKYLGVNDRLRCICVCKRWHKNFIPTVWKHLKIRDTATPRNVRRHRHLIHELDLDNIHESLKLKFPHLRSLSLGKSAGTSAETTPPYCDPASLISLNPSIVELKLLPIHRELNSGIIHAASQLPSLKILLILRSRFMSQQDEQAFWIACKNIEKLEMKDVIFSKESKIPPDLTFPELRKLQLFRIEGLDQLNQIEWISRCPKLEGLVWADGNGKYVPSNFAQLVASGTWPNLKRLQIAMGISDSDIGMVLEGMNNATKIEFRSPSATFSSYSLLALRKHFGSLVTLKLSQENTAGNNVALQEVFCSCPHLRTFRGHTVQGKDIALGGPWVCLSLRTLRIQIEFNTSTEEEMDAHQRAVFTKLSFLTKLEKFCVGTPSTVNGLDFKLCAKMGYLSGLEYLKFIGFPGINQNFTEEDITWMAENWKSLKSISGRLHTDLGIHHQLKTYYKSRSPNGEYIVFLG
ncbi:hypothetical protein BGZ76_000456, partial [Entomortierella beljakovae]